MPSPKDPAGADAETARPNIEWWQKHGGDEWLTEVERRRVTEKRYDKQEAWLVGQFARTAPLRVLDFGCGYGRHLRNLRHLGHLDLYGADMSPTQVSKVGEFVGDPTWARDHVRLIPPVGALPWPEMHFDVTFTSEVLIHVNPTDLLGVLAELARITFQRLVLIENKRSSPTRLSAPDHGGCWLHDFAAAFEELKLSKVEIIEDVLRDQDIYVVDLDRGTDTLLGTRLREAIEARDREIARLRVDGLRDALMIGSVQLESALVRSEAALTIERDRAITLETELRAALVRRVEADLARGEAERAALVSREHARHLADELAFVESSLARRVVRKAKEQTRLYGLARRAVSAVQAFRRPPQRQQPLAPPPVAKRTLPFADIATRARPETVEAFLARSPAVVGICHPDWRGIRASTDALCDGVLQIAEIATDDHAEAVARFLDDAGTKTVVIQGVPPGSERLARTLKRMLPRLRLLHVFHGSPAQHTTSPVEAELLDGMLELARAGVLDGLGFVKVGLAASFKRMGLPAFPIHNKVPTREPAPQATPFSGRAKVGVFVPNLWHKNLNTQVLAALTLRDSEVHVCEAPPARYFKRYASRLKVHGMMPHAEFIETMGTMDANLYVSLNECYPMTVLESLERGVVCLTSHTSPIFDDDAYLFDKLVVTRADDPGAIASKLEAALADRVEIIRRAHLHLKTSNALADELWRDFVNG